MTVPIKRLEKKIIDNSFYPNAAHFVYAQGLYENGRFVSGWTIPFTPDTDFWRCNCGAFSSNEIDKCPNFGEAKP